MHLDSLTLKNVGQFRHQTFKFLPGFNLLVGENGAGKTTILCGLLAALKLYSKLENNDIRLGTNYASISAVISYDNNKSEKLHFLKPLWESPKRSGTTKKRPLTLFYSSNEAVCSAMRTRPSKRPQGINNSLSRYSENSLYELENFNSSFNFNWTRSADTPRFGNSSSVRKFVTKMLSTFSPDMSMFYWRFEPYDCTLISPENTTKELHFSEKLKKQAQTFAMRWFEETQLQRKNPFTWPDRKSIVLMPDNLEHERLNRNLPNIRHIWEEMEISSTDKETLSSYSLEVKLSPRIMIERPIGILGLDQLSDGEQRLFSLFVDIARQLSLSNPDNKPGYGEAIVLIDEIDVHLHPKWQRRIVPALEDLFPNCQFIATTHSPFVIQATNRQKIISIDPNFFSGDLGGGNSIEDIAEDIQGIDVPQRSLRAERLSDAAKRYFTLLEKRATNTQAVEHKELLAAEESYREASEPFTSDPATHALLKILKIGGKD